jgi:hypothetical protein
MDIIVSYLSQLPMQHHWAGLVFRFWNHLVKRDSSLCHNAFKSDIVLALTCGVGWVHEVLVFLKSLDFDGLPNHEEFSNTAELVDAYASLRLPVGDLLTTMADRLMEAWHEPGLALVVDPRTYNGPSGALVCNYLNYMGVAQVAWRGKGRLEPLPHTKIAMNRSARTALMRFRLGTWDLAVHRTCNGQRRRGERVCLICAQQGHGSVIQDEKHVVLECRAFQALRDQYCDRLPFNSDCDNKMLAVMTCQDQKSLAAFLEQLNQDYVKVFDSSCDSIQCVVCGSPDDPGNMLICDGRCSRGFHRYHVSNPPNPADGSFIAWFCPDCSLARLRGNL